MKANHISRMIGAAILSMVFSVKLGMHFWGAIALYWGFYLLAVNWSDYE